MKKILILIVVIALFLHFNPQPEVNEFIEEQKAEFLDTMAEFSGTKVRMKASTILKNMESELSTFSPKEMTKLREITLTRDSVKNYYKNHCQAGQTDPEFHTVNFRKVCKHVDEFVNRPR